MQKASVCRLGTPCTPRTLKQRIACRTQHHPDLRFEEIAKLANIRRDRLYAYANDNVPYSRIPAEDLTELCVAVGDNDLLASLIEPYGWRLVEIAPASHRGVVAEVLAAVAAMGEVAKHIDAALKDGVLTAEEKSAVRAVLQQLRRKTDDVDAALDTNTYQRVA